MRRLPTVSDDESVSQSSGWLAGAIPDAVALRGLSVEIRGPETVTLGEPARFQVAVKNCLPMSVSVALPTSQLWGWQVDGVSEADERGYEPPDTGRTVAFARGERKAFSTTWDGRVRQSGDEGNVWVDREGTRQFTGYFAVEGWEERGLYDRMEVDVRE